jgi:hypothetical protein
MNKGFRFFSLLIAIVLFLSCAPSPVFASPAASIRPAVQAAAAAKIVQLTVTNKTGGTVYVTLEGKLTYYFTASNQGKTKFKIEGGTYKYTVRASNCGGSISKTKNFKNGGSLGPFVCKKK